MIAADHNVTVSVIKTVCSEVFVASVKESIVFSVFFIISLYLFLVVIGDLPCCCRSVARNGSRPHITRKDLLIQLGRPEARCVGFFVLVERNTVRRVVVSVGIDDFRIAAAEMIKRNVAERRNFLIVLFELRDTVRHIARRVHRVDDIAVDKHGVELIFARHKLQSRVRTVELLATPFHVPQAGKMNVRKNAETQNDICFVKFLRRDDASRIFHNHTATDQ